MVLWAAPVLRHPGAAHGACRMQMKSALERPRARPVLAPLFAVFPIWGMLTHAKEALIGDGWNGAPQDVNLHPERFWDTHDLQIARDAELAPMVLRDTLLSFTPGE